MRFVGGRRYRRVLIVDDNLDYVRSMTRILREKGHQVAFAINATAALSTAAIFRPDTVFLDVALPDGDGLLLAGPLRRELGLDSARIVCVTGLERVDRARALAAGCDDFHVKPLDPGLIEGLMGAER